MKNPLPLLTLLLAAVGCVDPSDRPVNFDPNLVHTMKYQIQQDIPMDQASRDSTWIVATMFGTPDEPKLPESFVKDEQLASLISLENVTKASGPTDADGRGLFRTHCANCHGVTGDGRGAIAAVQSPYPRDYRMGLFKFKSTPRGTKPTKQDLAAVIRDGIEGTAMIKYAEMVKTVEGVDDSSPLVSQDVLEAQIEALTDYVIFLSIRGELERTVVDMAIFDGVLEDGDRIVNTEIAERYLSEPEFAQSMDALLEKDDLTEEEQQTADEYEIFLEQWEYVVDEYLAGIADSWLDAGGDVVDAVSPPKDLPVAETYQDVVAFRAGDQAASFDASVRRGQQLFVGKTAACSTCHGKLGQGDGQTTDYDDWTKDWTTRVNLDPTKRETLIPLLARGALEPKNILPRNFADGIFRGGHTSAELYRRITEGIEGTPMPAATFVEGEFEARDVWHLVNFIRTLQTPPDPPVATQAAAEVAMSGR